MSPLNQFQQDAIKAKVKFDIIIQALLFASHELEVIGNSSELMALDEAMEALKAMKERADQYVKGE